MWAWPGSRDLFKFWDLGLHNFLTDEARLFVFSLLDRPWHVLHKGRWMTPKWAWPRSRVLLLKQWDRYPLPLLRPSMPIGWHLRLLRENVLAFLAVFYATHATQAIAFEWKPDLMWQILDVYQITNYLIIYKLGPKTELLTRNPSEKQAVKQSSTSVMFRHLRASPVLTNFNLPTTFHLFDILWVISDYTHLCAENLVATVRPGVNVRVI